MVRKRCKLAFFIFGDVHGQSAALKSVLEQAQAACQDEPLVIFSVGDLIDRGPDSKGVIETCIEHDVQLVLGNHELWLHEWAMNGKVNPKVILSPAIGGAATLASYGIAKVSSARGLLTDMAAKIPAHHAEYLKTASLYHAFEHLGVTYFITHGGLSLALARQIPKQSFVMDETNQAEAALRIAFENFGATLLWEGAKPGNVYHLPGGCVQIFGHTPWSKGAEIAEHYIALDTGCGTCAPHTLSGVLLKDDGSKTILQAKGRM